MTTEPTFDDLAAATKFALVVLLCLTNTGSRSCDTQEKWLLLTIFHRLTRERSRKAGARGFKPFPGTAFEPVWGSFASSLEACEGLVARSSSLSKFFKGF